MPRRQVIPKLPQLLDRKIYKSGQTRGADDDEIYQNRVGRTSTVLIPFHFWNEETRSLVEASCFSKGYIVLIKPEEYFSWDNPQEYMNSISLSLGYNSLVFYETRNQWNLHNPVEMGWRAASSRTAPLNGQYVARVPATTAAEDGAKINKGFTEKSKKGAGIRLYEFASEETVNKCKKQLEAEYWLCHDAVQAAHAFGMSETDALSRKEYALRVAQEDGLLDFERLIEARIINESHETVCPLCLERLSAFGFYNRLAQAEGREVPDLTVTEINLFHIDELRYGKYNHKAYNLGWGHHHCNVVVKDSGIIPTLRWMKQVIDRNEQQGTKL